MRKSLNRCQSHECPSLYEPPDTHPSSRFHPNFSLLLYGAMEEVVLLQRQTYMYAVCWLAEDTVKKQEQTQDHPSVDWSPVRSSSAMWIHLQFSLDNKSPLWLCSTCSSGQLILLMLTSWTRVVLCDKSDHSRRKAPPNSPSLVMNEQACKSPWSMGVTRKCHKPICLNCVQWPVISMGPCRNVCTSVYVCVLKKWML